MIVDFLVRKKVIMVARQILHANNIYIIYAPFASITPIHTPLPTGEAPSPCGNQITYITKMLTDNLPQCVDIEEFWRRAKEGS